MTDMPPSLHEAIETLTAKPLSEATLDDRLTAKVLEIALGDKKAGAIATTGGIFAVEVWGAAKKRPFLTQGDYAAIAHKAESTVALWLTRFRQPPNALVEEIPGVRINRQNRNRYLPTTTSFLEFIKRVLNRDGLNGDSGIVAAVALEMSEKRQMFANIGTKRRLAEMLGLKGLQAERTVNSRMEALTHPDAAMLVSLGHGRFTFHGPHWAELAPKTTSDSLWLSPPREADKSWSRRPPKAEARPESVADPESESVVFPVPGANPVREDPVSGSKSGAIDNITNNTVSNSPTPLTSKQSVSPSVIRSASGAPLGMTTTPTGGPLRDDEGGSRGGGIGADRVSEREAATGSVAVTARASLLPAAGATIDRRPQRLSFDEFTALLDAAFEGGKVPKISVGSDLVRDAVGHILNPEALGNDAALAEALRLWARTWSSTCMPSKAMFSVLWIAAEKAAIRSDPIRTLKYLGGVVTSEAAKYPKIAASEPSAYSTESEIVDAAETEMEPEQFDVEGPIPTDPTEVGIMAVLEGQTTQGQVLTDIRVVPGLSKARNIGTDQNVASPGDAQRVYEAVRRRGAGVISDSVVSNARNATMVFEKFLKIGATAAQIVDVAGRIIDEWRATGQTGMRWRDFKPGLAEAFGVPAYSTKKAREIFDAPR